MKKIGSVLLVISFLVAMQAPRTFAMVVYDPSVNSTLNTRLNASYLDQVKNTLNNLQSLQAQLQNLSSLDQSSMTSQINSVQNSLQTLQQLRQSEKGLTLDWTNAQQAWDSEYTDFKNLNGGISATDYTTAYKKLSTNTDNALYDAMKSQGLLVQLDDDQQNLVNLMKSSTSAKGALQAAQIGHQLTALEIQNMLRLQQILTMSNRAQTQYMLQQQQSADASSAWAQTAFKSTTTPSKGQGTGLGDFK
ncbi:Hypothetical protein LUCI_3741 [Lucifera butyrica]|uniref:P-type conjugative transfer protein TrbJ n=1 Tax=Lucifera butyrica TaxID=1351585 RepID=A0A498RB59_9FIRM|nr:hypothetical protein [Lucifera butyrica]VBB08469.1 Hypothetical protein LUCI_3741 [Lucifera butyrica]